MSDQALHAPDPIDATALRLRAALPHRNPHEDPRWEAHLPYPRGSDEDMAWRQARAMAALQALADYCEAHGLGWRGGLDGPERALEAAIGGRGGS